MYKIKKWNSVKYFARKLDLSLSDYYHHLENINSPWFKKMEYKTIYINLEKNEQELLASYKSAMRYDIKQARKINFKIEQNAYSADAIKIIQKVSDSHPDLVPYPGWLLKEQEDKFYTTIYHPEHGCVAAHLYIYDRQEKKVLLLINASDFRSYQEKEVQSEIGLANKLLFHSDFLYFKEMGAEVFDMGGYTQATKNFKKFFGGKIVKTYNYEPYPLYWLRQAKRKLL